MEPTPHPEDEPHVYPVSNRGLYLLVAAWLVILGLVTLSGIPIPFLSHLRPATARASSSQLDPATAEAFRILGGIVAVLAGAVWGRLAVVTRLVVTAQGLAYFDGLGNSPTITSTWSEAISIDQIRPGRETLVLANPDRRFNLSQFGSDWRTGALGQDLQAHAPQLFKASAP